MNIKDFQSMLEALHASDMLFRKTPKRLWDSPEFAKTLYELWKAPFRGRYSWHLREKVSGTIIDTRRGIL